MRIAQGLVKTLESSKGVVTLLTLIMMFTLAFTQKIDSAAVIGLAGLTQAVFCWTRMKSDNGANHE